MVIRLANLPSWDGALWGERARTGWRRAAWVGSFCLWSLSTDVSVRVLFPRTALPPAVCGLCGPRSAQVPAHATSRTADPDRSPRDRAGSKIWIILKGDKVRPYTSDVLALHRVRAARYLKPNHPLPGHRTLLPGAGQHGASPGRCR